MPVCIKSHITTYIFVLVEIKYIKLTLKVSIYDKSNIIMPNILLLLETLYYIYTKMLLEFQLFLTCVDQKTASRTTLFSKFGKKNLNFTLE